MISLDFFLYQIKINKKNYSLIFLFQNKIQDRKHTLDILGNFDTELDCDRNYNVEI